MLDTTGTLHKVDIGEFITEAGATIPNVTIAYQAWGTFHGNNLIVVEHALTGDSNVVSWWDGVVGIMAGILLIVMLFVPFLGPLIGIAFSLFWGFFGYALGSSFARSIGPVNSMIIGGVAALIGFSASLKAHLS